MPSLTQCWEGLCNLYCSSEAKEIVKLRKTSQNVLICGHS